MNSCILLAAGKGRRTGANENKIFLRSGDLSVLQRSFLTVVRAGIDEVVVTAAAGEEDAVRAEIDEVFERLKPAETSGADACCAMPYVLVVTGGAERFDSVKCGFAATNPDTEVVAVHDAARPFAEGEVFRAVIAAARETGAAFVGVPVTDTIKRAEGNTFETPERSSLRAAQTPQALRRDVFEVSIRHAETHGIAVTDDVSLAEAAGYPVRYVEGDYGNIKITTAADCRALFGAEPATTRMRVGFGYDVHRFVEDRPCVLGGVRIESPIGPDGHSDADVVLHALMDAMLGAAGLRDIGYYFPPEDEAYRGISSLILLERVADILNGHGFETYNADVTVTAEAPKLKPHIEEMKRRIGEATGMPVNRIAVKATTNEGMGFLGRREGIAAQAVVTVYERSHTWGR